MQTIQCHLPLKLRVSGEPTEDDWNALERALTAQYTRALRRSLDALERAGHWSGGAETDLREPFDANRAQGNSYLIASYDNAGAPTPIPTKNSDAPLSIADLIRQKYTESQGRPGGGVYYGIYIKANGDSVPQIYYLTESEGLKSFRLRKGKQKKGVMDLPAGNYTASMRPRARGLLYKDGDKFIELGNPEYLDVTVNFYAPEKQVSNIPKPQVSEVEQIEIHGQLRRRFEPRLRIIRVDDAPTKMTTGAQGIYLASVEIWRREKDGSFVPIHPLSLIYASVEIAWSVWKITPQGGRPALREPVQNISTEAHNSYLRVTWEQPGLYEIDCSAFINDPEAIQISAADKRTDEVVTLESKMAADLAGLEKADADARKDPAQKTPLWQDSPAALLALYDKELQAAKEAKPPNPARVRAIEEAIAGIRKQLVGQTDKGPFPIKAIFTERATGKSRPITLFVGPVYDPYDDADYRWKLMDVTYPAFYKTYEGTGETNGEALRAAFEDARTSFTGKYPPGRILANIGWPGMGNFGLKPFDFAIETESGERTAFDWLTTGAAVLGAAALAVSFVFPPSAFVTGAIVVSMAAGAAVSAINIGSRLSTNSFEWDVEAVCDVINLAASFAMIGGAVARGAATGMSKALAAGREVGVESAVAKLANTETLATIAKLEKFHRAMLFLGLTADVSNGFLLTIDTYLQVRDVDGQMAQGVLADYLRIYGDPEGQKRFETERTTRILGVLARAAMSGGLIALSVKGRHEEIGGKGMLPDATEEHLPPEYRPTDDVIPPASGAGPTNTPPGDAAKAPSATRDAREISVKDRVVRKGDGYRMGDMDGLGSKIEGAPSGSVENAAAAAQEGATAVEAARASGVKKVYVGDAAQRVAQEQIQARMRTLEEEIVALQRNNNPNNAGRLAEKNKLYTELADARYLGTKGKSAGEIIELAKQGRLTKKPDIRGADIIAEVIGDGTNKQYRFYESKGAADVQKGVDQLRISGEYAGPRAVDRYTLTLPGPPTGGKWQVIDGLLYENNAMGKPVQYFIGDKPVHVLFAR